MQRYIVMRFLQSLLALIILSVLIFILARATGDPLHLILPMQASEEDYANARRLLGLDKPWPVQYWIFISNAVQGDFGISLRARKPVRELLFERLPNSIKLAGFSLVVSLVVAFPLGIVSAVNKGTKVDTMANIIAVLGQSLPAFWVGILLIEVVAGRWQLLPAGGTGGVTHYILPGFTLGWFVVAGIMRLLRSSMLDVLDSEFVKMARVKGVPERWVIWKHALRNALIPVVTFGAIYFAIIVTTAIVVETVFAWPGMGRLTYEAITSRDFPVIQAVVLTTAVIVIFVNLGVDILYAYLDPRIRFQTR
jgi:ABC-type dipeptide/oligopeptide/nickel transport system permease component